MQKRWILVTILIGIIIFGSVPLTLSQSGNQDVSDYWGSKDDRDSGDKATVSISDGNRENIILGTDNIYLKIGWFLGLAIVVYLLVWMAFAMLIKGRSPARLFSICFFVFMIALFGIGWICFSEYALVYGYNEQKAYLAQLQWTYIITSACIWLILSFLATKVFKGKA